MDKIIFVNFIIFWIKVKNETSAVITEMNAKQASITKVQRTVRNIHQEIFLKMFEQPNIQDVIAKEQTKLNSEKRKQELFANVIKSN